MGGRVSDEEYKRRVDALEKTKGPGQERGNITQAAKALGMSSSKLSRWLLINDVHVGIYPAYSKKQCIEELHRLVNELGRVPLRDEWRTLSKQKVAWRTHWLRYPDFIQDAGISADDTKILLLDIETAPNRAWFWGDVWKQTINPDWIDANGFVLCWTAKWLGESKAHFHRLQNGKHKSLLGPMHEMLNRAQAVVHYNGKKFDVPTLNKEFITHGFTPPSPYKQIDLLETMREQFKFPSNKLDYICKSLSIGEKLRHEGPQLWMDCMDDDEGAWKRMEAYNRRDVELLEKLYSRLLPWIKKHPNRATMAGFAACPSCGSEDFKQDGTYLAAQLKYERYKCNACGTWFRGTKTISPRKGARFAATA